MKRDILTINTNKTDETLGSTFVEGIVDFIKEMLNDADEGVLTIYQDGCESFTQELDFKTDQDVEFWQLRLNVVEDFFEYYFQYKQYDESEGFDYKIEIVNGDKVDYCKIGVRTVES